MRHDKEKYSDTIDQIENSLYKMLYDVLPPEQKRLVMRLLTLLFWQAEKGVALDPSAFEILGCFFFEKYPKEKK